MCRRRYITVVISLIEYSHNYHHIMSKVSEEFTADGVGGVGIIPIAPPGDDITALRPPYVPSKGDQEAIPNPGIIYFFPVCAK